MNISPDLLIGVVGRTVEGSTDAESWLFHCGLVLVAAGLGAAFTIAAARVMSRPHGPNLGEIMENPEKED